MAPETGPPAATTPAIDPAEPVPGWAVQLLVTVAEIRRDLAPVTDHEIRIRTLERRAYMLAGVAALLGAGGGQLLDILTK